MSHLAKFTKDYLSYRKPTETGGVSYVERLPAGSQQSGKTHHVLHFCKTIAGHTSALVKHEERILDGLASAGVPYTVRLLDYQNSPNHQNPKNSTQTLVTESAGVDLCDWFDVPIFINELNRSFNNIYDHPLFTLAILKGALVALERIHQHNIIHCDIKLDNICLPFKGGNAEQGQIIQIQLDNITLIDFGVAYWIGNMGSHERNWLGYNDNEQERYQSILLIHTLKQWFRDNEGRTVAPYDNSSLANINYSCDLYSLGVAFEGFCQEGRYQHDECWGIVHSEFCAIIRELKSYDLGIPNNQAQTPHQEFIHRLDTLIQKIIAYESMKGCVINANYAHGKLLLHATLNRRKTPVLPTPTTLADGVLSSPSPKVATANTAKVIKPTNKSSAKKPAFRPVARQTHTKKSSNKTWIGAGVLLLVLALGAVMWTNKQPDPQKTAPTDTNHTPAQTKAQTDNNTATDSDNTLTKLGRALGVNDYMDYGQLKLIRSIPVSESSVQSLNFSPDGQYIVTASDAIVDGNKSTLSNMIFKVATGEKIKEFEGGNTSVNYSPDGTHIVASHSDESMIDNKITFYSIKDDAVIKENTNTENLFASLVKFSPNGNYFLFAVSGQGSDIGVYNNFTNEHFLLSTITKPFSNHNAIFSFIGHDYPDVVAVADTDIDVIDLKNKQVLLNVGSYYSNNNKPLNVEALAISPNGKNLATLDENGVLRIAKIDINNNAHMPHSIIEPSGDSVGVFLQDLAFTPNNLHLIHKNHQSLDIYSTSDMKKIKSIPTPETWSMDISPDGKYVALGTSYPHGQVLIYGVE